MSDVTPSKHPKNTLHMTITNFNYENSYLPGVICNIVVKADLGRSPGRCTPHTPNASWDIYYGIDLAAILDSSRKVGNFLLFLNNQGSKQSASIVQSCQMYPPQNIPKTPPNDNKRFQLWQVIFALNTSMQNLADEHTVADGCPQWIEYRCLEYCYTKLGRWTYFGWWIPLGKQE